MSAPIPPSPEPIFQIAQGFMAAKYLFAASELGMFAAIPSQGATLLAVATETKLPVRSTRIVLDALVALGLLRREGALYRQTAATEFFLSGRTPADIRPFLK